MDIVVEQVPDIDVQEPAPEPAPEPVPEPEVTPEPQPKKRGRPPGSKNKPKIIERATTPGPVQTELEEEELP